MERLFRNPEKTSPSTRLAILIDPPKQTPAEAARRVEAFFEQGGHAVLVGGSGRIDSELFQETTRAVLRARDGHETPVIIFPGHIDQIPLQPDGISGVLNYQHILGSVGSHFEQRGTSNTHLFIEALRDQF